MSTFSRFDGGSSGLLGWSRRSDGSYDVWLRVPNVLNGHFSGDQFLCVSGVAADDGFGNLVLIGGLT